MSFKEDEKTFANMEYEDTVKIEETTINLGDMKKELDEDLDFSENCYKMALTYENIFGESSKEQRNNIDSLIGFLDDDAVMETETVKLEHVKNENKDLIRKTIEQSHIQIIRCHYCEVLLEKQEHLENHMLQCLEKYSRLCNNYNLPDSPPTIKDKDEEVYGKDAIITLIDVDANYSTSTETIDSIHRSYGNDGNGHKQEHFHDEHMGTAYSNTSEEACKCSKCSSYQRNYKDNLKVHLNIHNDIKPFECSYPINCKGDLKIHLNTHSDINSFECDTCKQRFKHKKSLKIHIKNKHSNISEMEYKCSECSYQTNYKDSLRVHLNTHNDIKPFECGICQKTFNQKISLKLHFRNKHLNPIEKEYKCSECSYQTNYKSHIKAHSIIHSDIKPFECDTCKQRFNRKGSLKLHINNRHSNTDGKEYNCSECSFQTKHKGCLKRHLNTHTDIMRFQCDMCEKKFKQKRNLKQHVQDKHSDTNEKKYKCSECTYQANYKSEMQKHINKHSDIKPFECDTCKQKFKYEKSLKMHTDNKHSITSERNYKCSECSYQTNYKSSLKQHLNTHSDIKPFECDTCKKGFNHKNSLKLHKKNKH